MGFFTWHPFLSLGLVSSYHPGKSPLSFSLTHDYDRVDVTCDFRSGHAAQA